MTIIADAAEHIEKGEVKIISMDKQKIIIEVKDHIVIWERKNGRTTDSCDCENHSRYCIENPRCSHKLAACTFLTMKKVKI